MFISDLLKEQFPQYIFTTHRYRGDDTVILKREGLLDVARFLKENSECHFEMLMDLPCVDYLKFDQVLFNAPTTVTPSPLPFFMKPKADPKGEKWERPALVDGAGRPGPEGVAARFEVVYHFYSISKNHRIRLKVLVEEKEAWVETLTSLWASADWFEREVWDMYGIIFKNHPNLKRILMYEEFTGHPLRKDYPVNKRQPLIGPVN